MSLMDAPEYDARKDARERTEWIAAGIFLLLLVAIGFAGFFMGHGWFFKNLPAEHRVNTFFSAVEAKDFNRAFGLWNNDDAWQQHADRYKDYNFGHFQVDWGSSSDYGVIKTHRVVCSLASGSGVAVGVDVNGRPQPTFIWVQDHTHTLGFSPVEVEC